MGKKKQEQSGIGGDLISGLPQENQNSFFMFNFEGNQLKITEKLTRVFKKSKELQTFSLDVDKIISIDIITQDNIVEKQNSTFGRGVAGALLFGPVGAIIGTSSAGSTTVNEQTGVLVFSYYGKNEEDIKTIYVSLLGSTIPYARDFITYYLKNYTNEFKEQNENGYIIL